jgi:integrase
LSAILFLYKEVLEQDIGWLDGMERAKRPARLPVVLTATEVRTVLAHLDGRHRLMANLLYGPGLRLMIYTHVLNRRGRGVASPLDQW